MMVVGRGRLRRLAGALGGRYMAGKAILLALLCLPWLTLRSPAAVNAVEDLDTSKSCDLTITVQYETDENKDGKGEMKPVPGMKLLLYRVADLTVSNGGAVYQSLAPFASAGIRYEGMDASSSLKAAQKLAGLVKDRTPDKEGTTAADGTVTFTGLEKGMYLAVQVLSQQEGQGRQVRISPCLWQVPMPQLDEAAGINRWQYQTAVFPKAGTVTPPPPRETEPETEPHTEPHTEPPKPPQPPTEKPKEPKPPSPGGGGNPPGSGGGVKTGDTTPIAVTAGLMLSALAVIAAVIVIRRRRK